MYYIDSIHLLLFIHFTFAGNATIMGENSVVETTETRHDFLVHKTSQVHADNPHELKRTQQSHAHTTHLT